MSFANRCLLGLASLLGLMIGHATAQGPELLSKADRYYYEAVKPRQQELKWQQIPWLMRLEDAVKMARKEKRPIFLWVVDNEPLDRC